MSVVVTTYNAHDYLVQALDSLVGQGGDELEVIACDDGSSDDTLQILDAYRSRLNLRVVAREHTGNWIASMNRGLHLARGEYVSFLHHDDAWLEGRLESVRAALTRSPETVLLIHPSWFIDSRGARLGLWRSGLPAGSLRPDDVVRRLLVQNSFAMPAPAFRREAAIGVGGLDETLWHCADWDLWLKLAALGTVFSLDQPLTAYRIHPRAATWQGTNRAAVYRWQMDAVLDHHLEAWGSRRQLDRGLERVARFSIEANTRLAAHVHGHQPDLIGLVGQFLSLGPVGWHRYLSASRIIERSSARVRAGMLRWRGSRETQVDRGNAAIGDEHPTLTLLRSPTTRTIPD